MACTASKRSGIVTKNKCIIEAVRKPDGLFCFPLVGKVSTFVAQKTMYMVLETERLYLREMNPEDAEFFYLLNLDPEVVRYTGDEPVASVADAIRFLEKYDQYTRYGFGRWAVIRKEDDEFLGWCGLKYSPELDEVDVGFRFFKKYWNRGYATESARACVEWGMDQLEVDEIVGRAMKENTASIRVLEKIGLTYDSDFDFDLHSGVRYKIQRQA